jgi:hypothetical protein
MEWLWIVTIQWFTIEGTSEIRTLSGTFEFSRNSTASERFRRVSQYAVEMTGHQGVLLFYHCEKEK